MFIGRKKELAGFEELFVSKNSHIAVVYGRRRIGKSTLISTFAGGKASTYRFEGIEGERTAGQIKAFTDALRKQVDDRLLASVTFPDWGAVFTYLTEKLVVTPGRKTKLILVLDELQWMAAGQGKLVSLIKYYWDNHWKQHNVMLILCGSIASYMVRRVIRSKALYGRISMELLVHGLEPAEAAQFFGPHRSREEVLKYLLVLGTVPRYLEMVDTHRSFSHNINRLFFSPQAVLKDEVNRVFYSQFKEKATYRAIAELLQSGLWSPEAISRKLGISSGGGLMRYLSILEDSEIIRSCVPFDRQSDSRMRRFSLSDEYLRFHFKYIEPNRAVIDESRSGSLFELLTADSFEPWMGLAFERFCVKNAHYLAERMGFAQKVLRAAPYFGKDDTVFQIDLLYLRADKVVTLCEIKHYNKPVTTAVMPDVRRKCALIKLPAGHSLETALISLHGPDKALAESGFFDHMLTLEQILGKA